jgi:hypothetical protein
VLELNMRSYSQQTRQLMLAAIQRIVRVECQASGSPRDPEFENLFSFPVTVKDAATTKRVAAASAAHFGDKAGEKDGHLQDLPTNHSAKFLPPLQPSLRTGTEALVTAALAWLAPH